VDTGRYAKLFLSESREYLSEINNALLELERGASDTAVARLFRAVHTMKGMGGAMGYAAVSELSHELETLLDRLRTGSLVVTPVIMDTLFAGVDALEQAVDLATGATPTELDVTRRRRTHSIRLERGSSADLYVRVRHHGGGEEG